MFQASQVTAILSLMALFTLVLMQNKNPYYNMDSNRKQIKIGLNLMPRLKV